MSKWHGRIGFSIQEVKDPEHHPHVYEDDVIEKPYYGDILQNRRRIQTSGSLNDDFVLTSQISVLCNDYMKQHLGDIVYVTFLHRKWKVTEVSYEFPRVQLTLGDVYNG